MDEYDIDDLVCPNCGHSPTHSRDCTALYCEDGWVDETEFDPLEGDEHPCEECGGTGIERWCPECGADLMSPKYRKAIQEQFAEQEREYREARE